MLVLQFLSLSQYHVSTEAEWHSPNDPACTTDSLCQEGLTRQLFDSYPHIMKHKVSMPELLLFLDSLCRTTFLFDVDHVWWSLHMFVDKGVLWLGGMINALAHTWRRRLQHYQRFGPTMQTLQLAIPTVCLFTRPALSCDMFLASSFICNVGLGWYWQLITILLKTFNNPRILKIFKVFQAEK